MTARLDRLLSRVGHDVVVHPQVAVAVQESGGRQRSLCDFDVSDLYERHVFGALKTVTPDERECIELTYFDGLSVEEVAGHCGVSIQTVEDRLRHGLEHMVLYLRAHV
jgi:DNA-directed RNA polymerase specialized sigma24 family protein